MITLDGVGFAYEGTKNVLRAVSAVIEPGTITVLAGANGSGKSTLLTLLAGLYAPTTGRIGLFGLISPKDQKAFRAKARLVMQDPDLQILGATVEEDLLLGVKSGEEKTVAAAREAAGRLGLEECWETPVQTLSYGQKRKLCLAAAMVPRAGLPAPEVLLLDEPLSGLDYPGMAEMRSILKANARAGLTQIVTSHDLDPLADLASAIMILDHGEAPVFGPPAEVLAAGIERFGVRPPCSWLAGSGLVPWS